MKTFRLTDDVLDDLRRSSHDEAPVEIVCQLGDIEPGLYAFGPGMGWFRVDEEIGPEATLAWLEGPKRA